MWQLLGLILMSCMLINTLAKAEECEKLIIEGGAQALKQIFVDFNEIKTSIREIKSSIQDIEANNQTKLKEVPQLDLRYDILPKKCIKEILPKDCAEATSCTRRSGIYQIQIENYSNEPFYVECDADTENVDWLLIQRRHDGSVNFHRNWQDYEEGFGDVDGEFFIGLKKLYALTNFNGPQELMILMENANYTKAYAKYDTFSIGNDSESYRLKRLGKYSGTAGDSLAVHMGMKFTTKDRDNDLHSAYNCAEQYKGAWWHAACHNSHLNGQFGSSVYANGIHWFSFSGHNTSLKYAKMMIRRRRSSA